MHHQLHQVLDACVLGVTTLVTLATTVILNETPQDAAERMEMQLLLLPFIGSLCVSGGLIMLNPNPETRKITIGRGILALFFGVLGPQIVAMTHPSVAALSVKPVFLLVIGGLTSGLVFVLSKPFTTEFFKRSGGIAAREADRLENTYSPKPPDPPKPSN